MGTRFNSEYANLWKEVPLFMGLKLGHKRGAGEKGRVLIVDTCLVGEFAASLPAIREFMRAHPELTVDLMVAPPLKDLASRVQGVRKVYTAPSVYKREEDEEENELPSAYDAIIALRMSSGAREKLAATEAGSVKTAAPHFLRFGAHLLSSLRQRKTPKQWRTLNFEMLGLTPVEVAWADILAFNDEERTRVRNLPTFQSPGRVVIVHTGTKWPMKRWDRQNWADLLTRLSALGNLRFVFVGAPEDEAEYLDIAGRVPFPVESLVGSLSLSELVLALSEADYFIGIDSGPMNLAHLVDLPSVSILGPGPHMYLPWNPRDRYLDKTNGRGVLEMFFAKEKGFTSRITPEEAAAAFMHIYESDR